MMIKYLLTIGVLFAITLNINSQVDPLLQSANDKLAKRNFEGAIVDFNQILSTNPNNVDALCGRAEVRINLGNFAEATKDIDQAISLNNTNGRAFALKGEIIFNQKDYTNALKLYVQALQFPNAPAQATIGKSKSLNQLGYTKEAYKVLDDAIAVQPSNPEFYFARAVLNNTKEKYSKALQDLDKAVAINSEFNPFGISVNYGIAYFNLEETDKAIENFTKAIEIDPKNSSVFLNRGLAYYSQDNFKEAVEDFQKSYDLSPHNTMTMYNLGMAYSKLNDRENACLYFHKACQPGETNACKMVIMICSENKR